MTAYDQIRANMLPFGEQVDFDTARAIAIRKIEQQLINCDLFCERTKLLDMKDEIQNFTFLDFLKYSD